MLNSSWEIASNLSISIALRYNRCHRKLIVVSPSEELIWVILHQQPSVGSTCARPCKEGWRIESHPRPHLVLEAIMRRTLTNFFYLSRKKPKTAPVHKEVFQERVLLLGSVLGLKYKGCKSCIVAGSCVPTFCCLIVIVSKSLSQGMLGVKRKCKDYNRFCLKCNESGYE